MSLDQDTLQIVSDYLMNSEASIFEYQNYMIWKLLIYSDFSTPALIAHARSIVFSSDAHLPDVAGALIYMGRFGDINDKKTIVQQIKASQLFKNFFVQRHAIIAIQELEYADLEEAKCHIQRENMDVYRHWHRQNIPRYATRPPDILANELLQGVSIYVW